MSQVSWRQEEDIFIDSAGQRHWVSARLLSFTCLIVKSIFEPVNLFFYFVLNHRFYLLIIAQILPDSTSHMHMSSQFSISSTQVLKRQSDLHLVAPAPIRTST